MKYYHVNDFINQRKTQKRIVLQVFFNLGNQAMTIKSLTNEH